MKTNSWIIFRVIRPLTALVTALSVIGCAVGPDYKKPATDIPQEFRASGGPSDAASIADLPWWNVFDDTALQELIRESLTNNYDMQIAIARIAQARELVSVARSEALPQIGYQASAGEAETFAAQSGQPGSVRYRTVFGALNAAWEFDVWGRIRRSTESAQANLLAQEDVRRGVILTLVSDLAANYFQLIELDRELAIAQESSRVYKRTLNLFSNRFHAGKDSELPVQRTQAAYDSSIARVAVLTRQIAQQENAISVLLGDYPRAILRGRSLTKQVMPQTALGTTTDMLKRRPDILQAEQTMIAANAQIGVAVANFFPRVGLSALLGHQGVEVDDNSENFGIGNVFANLAGPIFTGGGLDAVYHERKAFWDETVAQYKKTVLGAFRETSDALVSQQNLVKQRKGLTSQVKALQRSVDIALDRYDGGRASYIEVLEAQQQLFPAQEALAQTQRDQLIAVVNLYKALGGGWQVPQTTDPATAENDSPPQNPTQTKGD